MPRLIAETDARSFGDSQLLCYHFNNYRDVYISSNAVKHKLLDRRCNQLDAVSSPLSVLLSVILVSLYAIGL